MKEPLFSSIKGIRHFLAVSDWCEKADLMTAGSCEADRGGPQGLLRRERGPTGGRMKMMPWSQCGWWKAAEGSIEGFFSWPEWSPVPHQINSYKAS
jgi:hypothetical protein